MKIRPLVACGLLACVFNVSAATCSLRAAVGATDDTQLIQTSIDVCAIQGGGELLLPARTYRITPIQLRSHVHLKLVSGTVLQGSTDQKAYERAFLGTPFRQNEALISGYRITDAGLSGPGVIDGQGSAWWAEASVQRKDGTMARLYPAIPDSNGMPRPWLMEFAESSQITLEGFTLQNSPMWNLVLRNSHDVGIAGITISNPPKAPNTDGIDLLSAQNVTIRHVTIMTGDDDIAIKSGLAGFGLPAVPTRNVQIEDVSIDGGHGISVGSETLNGIDHVTIQNVRMANTSNGFRIKTGRDRGADIGTITVRNVTMDKVATALSISAYYPKVPAERDEAKPVGATTPQVHDVVIENIRATHTDSAGQFVGLPEAPLQRIALDNIAIDAQHGFMVRDAGLEMGNVSVKLRAGAE